MKDYYQNLRDKWSKEKEYLNNARKHFDQLRQEYYADYYVLKNGDLYQDGSRKIQDRNRKNTREKHNANLLADRNNADKHDSWSIHFSKLESQRLEFDNTTQSNHQQHLAEMSGNWRSYKLNTAEYNKLYYTQETSKCIV
jgi:hypothetical protein